MADVYLTVGLDVKASMGEVQSDIDSILSGVTPKPIDVKVGKVDTSNITDALSKIPTESTTITVRANVPDGLAGQLKAIKDEWKELYEFAGGTTVIDIPMPDVDTSISKLRRLNREITNLQKTTSESMSIDVQAPNLDISVATSKLMSVAEALEKAVGAVGNINVGVSPNGGNAGGSTLRVEADTDAASAKIAELQGQLTQLCSQVYTITVDTNLDQAFKDSVSSIAQCGNSLTELNDKISGISNVIGNKDIVNAFSQMAVGASLAIDKIQEDMAALRKSMEGFGGFNINFNVGKGNTTPIEYGIAYRKVISELQAQVRALEDEFGRMFNMSYQRGQNPVQKLFMPDSSQAAIVDNWFKMFSDAQKLEGPLSAQAETLRQYIDSMLEAAKLQGIDISSVTSKFSASADEIVQKAEDTISGTNKVQDNLDQLKNTLTSAFGSEQVLTKLQEIGDAITNLANSSQNVSTDSMDALLQAITSVKDAVLELKQLLSEVFSASIPADALDSTKNSVANIVALFERLSGVVESINNITTVKDGFTTISDSITGVVTKLGELPAEISKLFESNQIGTQISGIKQAIDGIIDSVKNLDQTSLQHFLEQLHQAAEAAGILSAQSGAAGQQGGAPQPIPQTMDASGISNLSVTATLANTSITELATAIANAMNAAAASIPKMNGGAGAIAGIGGQAGGAASSVSHLASILKELGKSTSQVSSGLTSVGGALGGELATGLNKIDLEALRAKFYEVDEAYTKLKGNSATATQQQIDDVRKLIAEYMTLQNIIKARLDIEKQTTAIDRQFQNTKAALGGDQATGQNKTNLDDLKAKYDAINIAITNMRANTSATTQQQVDDIRTLIEEFNQFITMLNTMQSTVPQLGSILNEISISHRQVNTDFASLSKKLGGQIATGQNKTDLDALKQKYYDVDDAVTKLKEHANFATQDEIDNVRKLIAEYQTLQEAILKRLEAEKQAADAQKKAQAAQQAAINSQVKDLDKAFVKMGQEQNNMSTMLGGTTATGQNRTDLDALISKYKDVSDAITNLKTNSSTATQQQVNDVQTLINEYAQLVQQIRNRIGAEVSAQQSAAMRPEAVANYAKVLSQVETELGKCTAAERSKNEESRNAYAAIMQVSDQMHSYKQSVDDGTASTEEINAATANWKNTLNTNLNVIKANGDYAKTLGDRISNIVSKFSLWFSTTRVIMYAFRTIKDMVKSAIELDDAMTQMQIVTQASEVAMNKFADSAAKAAQRVGASITDFVDSATTFARLGYNMDESSLLAQYSAMLQNVGDIETSDAQDAITAIIKAFSDEIDISNIESVMDKLVIVGKLIAQRYSNVLKVMGYIGQRRSGIVCH